MASASTPSERRISDSFAQFDAILSEEVARISALSEENAHLRDLLSEHNMPSSSAPTSIDVDAAELMAELAAARKAKQQMELELAALRSGVAVDKSDEVTLLRESLATLAGELQREKERVAAVEAQRREEEDKVNTLRSKVEESRRALMRLQGESSSRRTSLDLSASGSRRSSWNLSSSVPASSSPLVDSARRRSSLGLAPSLTGLGFACVDTASPIKSNRAQASRRLSGGLAVTKEDEEQSGPVRESPGPPRRYRSNGGNDADVEGDFPSPPKVRTMSISSITRPEMLHRTSISEEDDENIPSPPPAPLRLQGRKQSLAVFANTRRMSDFEPMPSEPPSANLRMQGRKQSVAVFENTPSSRRASIEPSFGGLELSTDAVPSMFTSSPFQPRPLSISSNTTEKISSSDLRGQLEGLRIQLAESEEGRRASELCLKALKDFIQASPAMESTDRLRLPPLPTDTELASPSPVTKATSRWGLPRLPSLGSRSPGPSLIAAFSSPNPGRKDSVASTFSIDEKRTPSAPSTSVFGSFSFGGLVAPPSTAFPTTPMRPEASPLTSNSGAAANRGSFDSISTSCSDASDDSAPSLTDASTSESDTGTSTPTSPEMDGLASPELLSEELMKMCEEDFGVSKMSAGLLQRMPVVL